MNGHVTRWIAAYHDGELHGNRREQVEEHLSRCAACRSNLEELRRLSALLQENPDPASQAAPERFAARVRMRLPQTPSQPGWQNILKVAWQAAPIVLIAGWVFAQAILSLAGLAAIGGTAAFSPRLGLAFPLQSSLSGSIVLNQVGSLLSRTPWLAPAGLAVVWFFFSLGLSFSTGMLLWGWVASWWARQRFI